MPTRTPDEIRASIEQNRQELGVSLERLRGEVVRLTDWRTQLHRHQPQAIIAAGVAGFVVGGGIAALGSIVFGRRKKQEPQSLTEALKAQLAETVASFSKR
jgi:Protein of unknown function (DUF3618)